MPLSIRGPLGGTNRGDDLIGTLLPIDDATTWHQPSLKVPQLRLRMSDPGTKRTDVMMRRDVRNCPFRTPAQHFPMRHFRPTTALMPIKAVMIAGDLMRCASYCGAEAITVSIGH